MADGKWLAGLAAETPVDEAARTALTIRLGTVRHFLPLAAEKANEDIEYVHQLRVATRRAAAVVRIFEEALPQKSVRHTRRVLRKLRRAAGAARDWDVFLLALAGSKTARLRRAQAAIDFLDGFGLSRRLEAQLQLAESAARESEVVAKLCEDLPSSIKGGRVPHDLSLGELGLVLLPPLASEFQDAARTGTTAPEVLHRIRIASKRLRYAMEVFAGCYRPPFKDRLYPDVERAQTILGSVQDAHVAIDRLGSLRVSLRSLPGRTANRVERGLVDRTAEIQAILHAEMKAFRTWMKDWNLHRSREPFDSYLTLTSTSSGLSPNARRSSDKARRRTPR